MLRTYYTARELAGLPGLPGTERAIQIMADREDWPWQKRAGRGGGREYPVNALPQATRDHLLSLMIATVPVDRDTLPAERPATVLATAPEKQLPAVTALKDWQRAAMDARLFFMRLVERAEATGIGVTKAIRTLADQAADGTLPDEAARLVPVANQRSGKDTKKRALSERTLFKWWSEWVKRGKNAAVLAPGDGSIDQATGLGKIPVWGATFLDYYRKPQKPTVAGAIDDMRKELPKGSPIPSYHQACRFLKKVGSVELEKGRRTGQELRSIKPYIIRDTTDLWPGEIYISDGLTFKSWGVAHPAHGRPFSPEICDVVDVATRRIVGWSVGLAESGQVMAAALRNSIETNGIPAGWYHDNGPGYENALLTDDVTGILARCGITNITSVALQSQSRGIIEKLRRDLWHKAAKTLPTYKGRDMDRLVGKQVYKIVKKDMRESGTSEYMQPWPEFLVWVAERIDEHNNRPHRSLGKIRDPETGKVRHMTPNEAEGKARAEGWTPMLLDEHELADLFLPEKLCKVHRGLVRLFGNTYYAAELEEHHGDHVRVGYDIHDPRTVRIRLSDGRLLCFARFEANKRRYVPVSVSQQMIETRAAMAKKRLDLKYEKVELERLGTVETRPVPETIQISPEVIATSERVIAIAEKKRKLIGSVWERYLDVCEREQDGTATDYERKWKKDYEEFGRTRKKIGLYKEDEYCLGPKPLAQAQG